jgi:2-polyprenyl-3-methyl-5-hydroxy-6-metoxy-1,4-benzoquinol methylase
LIHIQEEILSAIKQLENSVLQSSPYQIKEFYYTFYRRLEVLSLVARYVRKRDSTILDAGAGQGFHSFVLKKMGYNVIAVDIDDSNRTFYEENRIVFYKLDLENDLLPLEPETVDCILFTEVIEHLRPSRIAFIIDNFYRVLKIGGVLILSTPNVNSIGKCLRRLVGKPMIPDIHVKEYSMKELVDILTKRGFKVIFKRYSLSTYLNPRKASKPQNYKSFIAIELFRTPHIENIIQFAVLPIAVLIPPLRGSLILVAKK